MNTNRSDKLGSTKALKLFGSRRGLAPYNAVQQVIAYKRLSTGIKATGVVLQRAFNAMADAIGKAAIDFHQFARFVNHGPIQSDLGLQSHLSIVELCGANPWYDADSEDVDPGMDEQYFGSPGVSVQDLADLAQQYMYLHPAGPAGPGGPGGIRK